MATLFVHDVYECKVGGNDIGGATGASFSYGYRPVTAQGDATRVMSARDRDIVFGEGSLSCLDLQNFHTILAAAEGGITAWQATGKIFGDNAFDHQLSLTGCRLAGASLSLAQGGYAQSTFNWVTHWGSYVGPVVAATALKDRFSFDQTGAITNSPVSGHAYRITDASYIATATDIQAFGAMGFNINIVGSVIRGFGDSDFGETVDVTSYDVTGSFTLQDETVAAALSTAQSLLAATTAAGQLELTVTDKGGVNTSKITIDNMQLLDASEVWSGQGYAQITISFGVYGLDGTTEFTLAGSNPIIAIT